MLPIRLSRADAAAVRAAMREMRELGLLDGKARAVRLEMWLALWHRDGQDSPSVRASIAYLAGMAYLRERLHLAPTAEVSRPAPLHASRPSASWFGMLTTDDED